MRFRNLMIVDDDEDDREFFIEVIQNIDDKMVCITAENGQEAIDKLTNGRHRPDVIFLDLNMPLMNGRQFLMEIKKHAQLAHIPVVILTTSSDLHTKVETKRLGALDFITKPDRITAWETTLREFLSSKL